MIQIIRLGRKCSKYLHLISVGQTEADQGAVPATDKSWLSLLAGYLPDGRGRLTVRQDR